MSPRYIAPPKSPTPAEILAAAAADQAARDAANRQQGEAEAAFRASAAALRPPDPMTELLQRVAHLEARVADLEATR